MLQKKERKKIEPIDVMLAAVVKGLQEKKGLDIISLDLQNVQNAVVDFFVICSATSDTHADALTNSVEKEVWESLQEVPWSVEGKQNKQWILLDYVNIVVHIFRKDRRSHYALEELWGDAEVRTYESAEDYANQNR